MQRAAANSQDTASTVTEEPNFKRRKTSARSTADEAIRAELAREEARRTEAVERQAALVGETRWAFSIQNDHDNTVGEGGLGGLRVVTAGYASIDDTIRSVDVVENEYEPGLRSHNRGRRRYGLAEQGPQVRRRRWPPTPRFEQQRRGQCYDLPDTDAAVEGSCIQ